MRRVLVIMTKWPSTEHPYLIYLYNELRKEFPNMTMFLFKKVEDTLVADNLIGSKATRAVLSNAIYRFPFTRNPFKYIVPIVKWIFYPLKTIRIYKSLRADGYSRKKASGQLLFGYSLIGAEFDLIYINSLQIGRHVAVSSFFPSAKILASSRGQDFDWHPDGYDHLLRKLDHLHVLGTYLQNKAIERNFPADRITIIPPAILPVKPEAKPQGQYYKSERRIQIVTAARLIWTKGYVYSLRAIALLREKLGDSQPIRYVILGQGEDLEFLKFEIKRLDLLDVVVLNGWVEQDEVNHILTNSHIYLLLSIEEGFNNSVMQAQSLGIPCIVSDAGGLPENVVHEATGYVVPRYDCEAAGQALLKLISDQELRHNMGERAKSRMRREFSLAMQSKKYADLFMSCLKERK